MRNIKVLYNAYRRGTRLDNNELVALRDHMRDTSCLLSELGDAFYLPFKEAHFTTQRLSDYVRQRGIEDGNGTQTS